jgi:transposase-like protein
LSCKTILSIDTPFAHVVEYGFSMVQKDWQTQWSVAALTDLAGKLGRPISADELRIPARIDLNAAGTHLVWSYGAKSKSVKPSHAILDEFVRLWNESPESILRFARKWGVFQLDEDGSPCRASAPENTEEAIETWRHFSRRACAVLNIAANVNEGKPGPIPEWEQLSALPWLRGRALEDLRGRLSLLGIHAERGAAAIVIPDLARKEQLDSRQEKAWLALEVLLWLTLGKAGFAINLNESGRWALVVDYRGCVFSAIAMQLTLAIAGAESLYTCTGCGMPYVRTKKLPRADQANFCQRCGRDEALRQADRRRREKMAEARHLASGGASVAEIAAKLETKPVSVLRWLKKGK